MDVSTDTQTDACCKRIASSSMMLPRSWQGCSHCRLPYVQYLLCIRVSHIHTKRCTYSSTVVSSCLHLLLQSSVLLIARYVKRQLRRSSYPHTMSYFVSIVWRPDRCIGGCAFSDILYSTGVLLPTAWYRMASYVGWKWRIAHANTPYSREIDITPRCTEPDTPVKKLFFGTRFAAYYSLSLRVEHNCVMQIPYCI